MILEPCFVDFSKETLNERSSISSLTAGGGTERTTSTRLDTAHALRAADILMG
jgi:hypothetical protein